MRIQHVLSIALLGTALLLPAGPGLAAPPVQAPEPPGEPPAVPGEAVEAYPFDLKEVVNQSALAAAPQGGIIEIATDDAADEWDAAVALCASDQYLVVYRRDGEIYGQRLESDGDLLGSAFQVSEGPQRKLNPDVACDWLYNRFVVVWQYDFYGDDSDYDVRARGVYGGHQASGSQLYGTELAVAQAGSGVWEWDPAIACNSFDHTCLVAFAYSGTGDGDIYGQRVSVGGSNIGREGSPFTISGYGAAESNPDVAWGGFDDDYLVVWQYVHDTPSPHDRVFAGYVWDTNQAGSQVQTAGTYLIGPGSYDHDQLVPAAAYNPRTRQYLVVFEYDYYGNGTDWDVEALRLTPGSGSWGGVFNVAATERDEEYPAVAYSGGTQSFSGGMGADQFLVTYRREGASTDDFYAQAIKGTYATSGSQREGTPVHMRTVEQWWNQWADVTGSINNGRYMVVWSECTGGDMDCDVMGQMVVPYAVYLPAVLDRP
jgi:hypothetical protein